MELKINKLQFSNVFNDDFNQLQNNNVLEFSKNICVIYAPNGVGKSSFCKALSGQGQFSIEYGGNNYNENSSNIFHFIKDQNARNIIEGDSSDFILGDNISLEMQLSNWINEKTSLSYEIAKNKLRNEVNITKKSDDKIRWIQNDKIKEIVEKIANSRAKYESLDVNELISVCSNLEILQMNNYEEDKLRYFVENYEIMNCLMNTITIKANQGINKLEEYNDAITLLEKYPNKNECIVCDSTIDSLTLYNDKKSNKTKIIESLDENTKRIFNSIISKVESNNPFRLREKLIDIIANNNLEELSNLKNEIKNYKNIFLNKINIIIKNMVDQEYIDKVNKYNKLLTNKLEFSAEDIILIQEFVADNIGKSIQLARKDNNKIIITLDNKEFLGEERENLHLSTGEQNFISLAFEFLKAKKESSKIIIIDDPVSSFDSLYKNKLVYAITKILKGKKVIITTHNTDLLRLLNVQINTGYNLYILNNTENGNNGFIEVSDNEKDILIFIPKLLKFIRETEIEKIIIDKKLYLYSMIPFMRGYANFIGNEVINYELTKVMHGYNNEVVNITNIYNILFNKSERNIINISSNDILSLDIENLADIINKNEYPLLNMVLKNNLKYYYIRMKTEKVLVDKFNVDYKKHEMLSDIINNAFHEDSQKNVYNRVFFFSRKTLLNEFNHFDGNMNIFEPAIDISENHLKKEIRSILNKLNEL